ncbi:MAG: lipoate--protein ligase family protein [Verrucomicrobiota bacterium]
MTFLELTLPSPAENLAGDEALLDWREAEGGGGILRFWQSPEPFVVVGYANKVATEVNVKGCRENNVPVRRRCSGGGTVLQGPGVLNYALVLPIEENSPTATINAANRFIMERNREALERLVQSDHPLARVSVEGHTDLAVTWNPGDVPLKFSGNAQRRKKAFLLFHGTFLLESDLDMVAQCLATPSMQPEYRHGRSHLDFITNLRLPAGTVKESLRTVWRATSPLQEVPRQGIESLTRDKYATNEWNSKF